jgi:hypothetical protein
MGNSLWKAIEREQWMEVKAMLSDERSHQLVRTQMYSIRRQIFPKVETEEQVWILHFLLWKAAPLDVVQLVLDIDPTQLNKSSLPSEELPVHFAAMNPVPGFNMDALEVILQRNPEALAKKSLRGQTPLHIACESLQPIWFIKKLVSTKPSTIGIRDAHDQTPWDILQIKSGSLLYYNNRLKGVLVVGPAGGEGTGSVNGEERRRVSSPTRKKQKLPPFKNEKSVPSSGSTARTEGTLLVLHHACVVCTQTAAQWAIVPCGHLCLCQGCAGERSNARDCPVCEQPIERCIQIIAAEASLSISDENNHLQ